MFNSQVLNKEKADTELVRPYTFGGFAFNIQDIEYFLDGRGATCSMMQFLCVEFGKADDPDPVYPQLPFTIEGVLSEYDPTPAPENLIGCTPFSSCEGS